MARGDDRPPGGVVSASLPLVGRRGETQWLEEQFSSALAGSPRLALICGDAGVGKTRLLSEFRPRMESEALVAVGNCYEHSPPAYLPMAEILARLLAQFPDALDALDKSEAESIRQILGLTVSAVPGSSPEPSPDSARLKLYLAVSRLLMLCAARRPLAIMVEDAHWMDSASLELLTSAVTAISDHAASGPIPIAAFVTYRPADLPPRVASSLARWERQQVCSRIDLGGLSEMEIAVLIRGAGYPKPSHQLVATITNATRGNPLYVQEGLRYLDSRGALVRRSGWLASTLAADEIQLPGEVTEAIRERINGLEPACRNVLTAGALLGDSFTVESLEGLSEGGDEDLLAALERCSSEGLLTYSDGRFLFSHPLIRHACYAGAIEPRRQKMHLRIAEMLEQRWTDTIDEHIPEVARHLIAAGPQADPERAMEYTREAAERSFRVFAWGDAAMFYEGALAAANRWGSASPRDQAELHFQAGMSYHRDLDVGPCRHHLDQAAQGFREVGDKKGLGRALALQMRSQITQASIAYGERLNIEAAEQALAELGSEDDELRAELLCRMSQVYWTGRQPEKAREVAGEALALGVKLKHPRIRSDARMSLGLGCLQMLDLQEAVEHWQGALGDAEEK